MGNETASTGLKSRLMGEEEEEERIGLDDGDCGARGGYNVLEWSNL